MEGVMTYVDALINFSEKPEDIKVYEQQFGKNAEKIIEKAKIINRFKAKPSNISKAAKNDNMEYPVSLRTILGILRFIDDLEDEYSQSNPSNDDVDFMLNDYMSEPNYDDELFPYEEVEIYPEGATEDELYDELRESEIWKMMGEGMNFSYMRDADYEYMQRNNIKYWMEEHGSPIITNHDYIMYIITFLPDSVWWFNHRLIAEIYLYGCTVKKWHLTKKNDHYKCLDVECSPIALYDKLQKDGEYCGYTTRQRCYFEDCISWMKGNFKYYKLYSGETLMSQLRQLSHMFIEDVFLPSDISEIDSYVKKLSENTKSFDSQGFIKLINLQAYKRNVVSYKGSEDIKEFIIEYNKRRNIRKRKEHKKNKQL